MLKNHLNDKTESHYLHLQHHKGKLLSTIECLGHNLCDAAARVKQEDASSPFAEYSLLFEYFQGEEALLQEGEIILTVEKQNNFVQWNYAEKSYVNAKTWEKSVLQENPSTDHALLGTVSKNAGINLNVLCLRPENFCGDDCVVDLLNNTVELLETCNSETHFRSDYIAIKYHSHVAPSRDDAATEYDSDLTWTYWNEQVGAAQFASENVL